MPKKEIDIAPSIEVEQNDDWMNDINMDDVEKVAKLDIKPQLSFDNPTKDNPKIKEVVSILTLPKDTTFADGNVYKTMDVLHDGIIKQMVVQAKSFRFSLAVLLKKFGNDKIVNVNTSIQIEKYLGDTKERKNVPLYSLTLIE